MQDLSWETYQRHQSQLLDWEAEKFLCGLEMTTDGSGYTIQFPDEYKKSLYWSRVNTMLVYPTGQRKVKYRGCVTSVNGNSVSLVFNRKSSPYRCLGKKFDVKFTDNSWNVTNQREAVKNAGRLKDVLFPSLGINSAEQLPDLSLFNKQLEKDSEQRQAVQHIVAGTSKPAAYVLLGPPGTGKTVTLVEAILQIEKKETSNHILACAAHNKDADLICQEIVKISPNSTVLRVYAKSVAPNKVPGDLKDCRYLDGKEFFVPKEKLRKHKIIVTTLFTAKRLMDLPKGHFTHIFLDNVECARETECLIPISGFHDEMSGQLVVAGDPNQLGPIVKSRKASQHGMRVSLLERWVTTFPLYQKEDGQFNKCYITKLQHNYRSHPAILKVPGDLFADGELNACSDTSLPSTQISNSCANWDHLPVKGFPVVFHAVYDGVAECDKRSFYNTAEVKTLMQYVSKLLRTKGTSVQPVIEPSDIGIMARYKKQEQEISKALKEVGMDKLKVGTVESFRGQGRRVILLSTVCSSGSEGERMGNPEFVQDGKAFYVAVTRAKALLIVVGDPTVWRQGDTWDHFIKYCRKNGGYVSN